MHAVQPVGVRSCSILKLYGRSSFDKHLGFVLNYLEVSEETDLGFQIKTMIYSALGQRQTVWN